MTRPEPRVFYIAAPTREPLQLDVAKAVVRQFVGTTRLGVFRPLAASDDDMPLRVLSGLLDDPHRGGYGVTVAEYVKHDEALQPTIVNRFAALKEECDTILVLGSDHDSALAPVEFGINARIASHLGASMVIVSSKPDQAQMAIAAARRRHVPVSGVVLLGAPRANLGVPTQHVDPVANVHVRSFRLDRQLFEPAEEPALTPLRFQGVLQDRARKVNRRIVLPEGNEDRMLIATHELLATEVCRITLLGEVSEVRGRARELGLEIDAAEVVDPELSPLRDRFAKRYAELRAKKGVTLEQAHERVGDVSYFGTMMVLEGIADGMVSGAAHTTAETIRPAFEVIKTRPGVSVVSSAFFMCLADRVLVYGDCAVNPNPTAEQLADIAISSAATAEAFGIPARVAMLSYSTGGSGTGPDVDLVTEATAIARQRAPQLALDGPLQYDAAVDPAVGRQKLPDSPVAGRATVLIFPDLSAGNAAYKAVQRSARALAIGPVLQGLNRPVNDLSRGALVPDIVNTVAITAIQAAGMEDA